MRLFMKKRDDGAAPSRVAAVDEQQEPLLSRLTSRQSYGSNASNASPVRPTEHARSKRRRTRIRSSVYADPPASYRRALISYTLTVTLSSIIFLFLFGALKIVAWPHTLNPSPIREFLLAAAGWIVAFALRIPILYIFTLFNTYVNTFTVLFSTFFQVVSEESIRLAILVLIQLHLERPEVQNYSSLIDPPNGSGPDNDWSPVPEVWDQAFTQVWWIALGWATIDVAVGIVQGYEQLSLYRDVLARERSHVHRTSPSPIRIKRSRSSRPVTTTTNEEPVSSSTNLPLPPHGTGTAEAAEGNAAGTVTREETEPVLNGSSVFFSVTPAQMHSTDQLITLNGNEAVIVASPRDLEAELSHMIARKQRAELEEVYGSPLPRIPIFLIALQRLDSILLSIGLTLLISSAYLRAFYLAAIPSPDSNPDLPIRYKRDWEVDWSKVKDTTIPVFAIVVLVHFILSTLWIEALPRIGVHTASYVGLLVSLTAFFAGLGYWGALV